MGNKDEKTFADLFSSSTTEKEETTQTFSDILNNSNEETKENSSNITFDSIFDKIPSEEKSDSSLVETQEQEQEPVEIKIESPNETPQSSATDMDSPFFSSVPEEITNPNEIDIFEKNTEIEKNEEKENSEPNNINLFFEEPAEKENDQTDESIEKEEIVEESKQEVLQEENPFFESSKSTQFDLTQTKEDKVDSETETVVESNEQPKEEEIELLVNPFMNNEEVKKDENIIENPFLSEKVQINEEKELTQQPQVTESTDDTPKENNIKPTEEKKNIQQEPTEKKSTSPFFEEEKKTEEENPFFQNQINLIENQTPNASSGNIDTTKSKHYNVKIVKKKEPLIKFILGVISYALFIWLLLIGITLLIYVLDIKIRAAKGDYSSPTFNAYVVLTGSMLPEIEVSDVVITKKVDAADLKEGDVITFASADSRFSGTIITHRIIKKNPKTDKEGYTFQTKGDNNNVADNALVPEKNIYGKVILKIPKLGYLQEFLASDGGWIIVILIPCLVVISYDIVKLAKGLKRKKYKNIKVQK